MRRYYELAIVAGILTIASCAAAQAQPSPRTVVAVSDLHLGVGKTNGQWNNLEDFRWPNALRGFLETVGTLYGNSVDLVLAGDLLELWQHPTIACTGCGPNFGCTTQAIEDVARDVVRAHRADLKLFGDFADRGSNRVIVVPGNHDAALLLDDVWDRVKRAMGGTSGRVARASTGVWGSDDGFVVVEHGHQIKPDVNRFERWPTITDRCGDPGQSFVERPWGESFVQKLYNDVESGYPIIDNLIPESVGAALYSRRRGVFGSVADFARFIAFNVFQTSLRQKIELDVGDASKADAWDVKAARARGHRLLADTFAPDDPYRARLLTSSDQEIVALRTSMDALVRDEDKLPDAAVLALCDQVKIRATQDPSASVQLCTRNLALSTARGLLPLTRVLAPHLAERAKSFPNMRIFIYGHSHQADFDITVKPTPTRSVAVLNTGAFQRLIDQENFNTRAAAKQLAPEEALAKFTLEDDFPACYSAVVVTYDREGIPQTELRNWFMQETDASGTFLDACDLRCGARPPRCSAK